jgi:hypothetical protein
VNTVASEIEIRRNDRDYLFQILEAQYESTFPADFEKLIARTKSKMEPEDVKLVLQGFDEWRRQKESR